MADPKPLTTDQLNEIAARAAAATPGPWCTDSWEIYQGAEYVAGAEWIGETCRGTTSMERDRNDAAFVAAARTDVPALLAEVRRLQTERDAFREQRNRVCETNRRLIAEAEEAGQARLRAENEVRTLWRSHREEHPAAGEQPAAEGAQR